MRRRPHIVAIEQPVQLLRRQRDHFLLQQTRPVKLLIALDLLLPHGIAVAIPAQNLQRVMRRPMNTYSACGANGSCCIPSRTSAASPFLPRPHVDRCPVQVHLHILARPHHAASPDINADIHDDLRITRAFDRPTRWMTDPTHRRRSRRRNRCRRNAHRYKPRRRGFLCQAPPVNHALADQYPLDPTSTRGASVPSRGSTAKNSRPAPPPGADASDTLAPVRSRLQGSAQTSLSPPQRQQRRGGSFAGSAHGGKYGFAGVLTIGGSPWQLFARQFR